MKLCLGFVVLLLACRHSPTDSDIKWAHSATDRAISVINARLDYLNLGFRTDFSDFKICIQNSATYSGPELLLDAKLAYAAWLEASGKGSEDAWQRMQFQVMDRCSMKDNAFSSVVVIGDEDKISEDQEIDRQFQRGKAECLRQGNSVSCSTSNLTMGFGGPGSIGYSYFQAEKWESVSNRSPATVILSPYVTWISLREGLEGLADVGLRNNLSTAYRGLSERSESVSYPDLVAFHKQIQDAQAKGETDPEFAKLMDSFMKSDKSSLSRDYKPRVSAFHVLLHEVGHQFGMDHSDNPGPESETGTSGDSELKDGKWVTKIATMAYADRYFYLTHDDSTGIRDLADKISILLKSRLKA